MVYLDADNDLESYGIDDFLEMASVGSTDEVAIVVLIDRWESNDTRYGDWTDARLYYIEAGEEPSPTESDVILGEINMGDKSNLEWFIEYTITNYPAEHYMLVLWDHGGAYQGVCWDFDNNNDALNLTEIMWAISEAEDKTGIKLDIVGFDACLMGTIEVVCSLYDFEEMEPLADYVVFSQESIAGYGWPYNLILANLTNNPDMDPYAFARTIVDCYADFYYRIGNYMMTLSVVNVSYAIRHLIPKLNRLASACLSDFYLEYAAYLAINESETFNLPLLRDIKSFLRKLRNYAPTEYYELIDTMISTVEEAVVYHRSLDWHPEAYGLSALFYITDYSYLDYLEIYYSMLYQWDELVLMISSDFYSVDCYDIIYVWFHDMYIDGQDYDNDGYLDTNIRLCVDLDSLYTYGVLVSAYIYNHRRKESKYLESYITIINGTERDPLYFDISVSVYSEYSLFIYVEIYDELFEYWFGYKYFYIYCDDDTSEVKLEPHDTNPPAIKISYPQNNSYINRTTINITWSMSDDQYIDHVEVSINGSEWTNIGNTTYYVLRDLGEGLYEIHIRVFDGGLNYREITLIITVDITPPTIQILSPDNNTEVHDKNITININVSDNIKVLEILVYVNGSLNKTLPPSTTSFTLTLKDYGKYIIKIVARDHAQNSAEKILILKITPIIETTRITTLTPSPTPETTTTALVGPVPITIAIALIVVVAAIVLLLMKRK